MARNSNNAPAAPIKFTKVQSVSLPDFTLAENERPYYVKITGPFVTGQPIENKQTGLMESAPTKCRAIDLEHPEAGDPDTGEVSMLVPSLVRNQIDLAYPGSGYIGRAFEIIMHAEDRKNKKRYRTATIAEIDVETGGESEV